MKLYLSSYRLGNNPEKLMELFSDNKNVAVIANAMDFVGNSEREESVRNSIVELENLRLLPEEVDLRDYFNNKKDLIKKLNNCAAVYVRGGNTFVLKRAMVQSSFDKWIKNKTKDPNFVYAGYSAGICILSPTLHGLELVDDPSIIPEGYNSEIDWNGLNLVNFSFAPHYKSDHPESGMVDREVEYFIKHKMPFKTFRDGEVLIM
ncbi:MAG: Type 1 glutamine amidotransferase-like domain-containing protein [Candidatus Levybacteria bacterium]|nr:Type 1 glutamine amidotransferase-like domain-containing protein [Candidatus Levybacteria bacterium]